MKITSVEEFKKSKFEDVEIHGPKTGTTFCVRLKRISLLGLLADGLIPNQLMTAANELFGTSKNKQQNTNYKDFVKVLDIICREALVEPSYDEIGEYLTDDQKNDIFEWTQSGVVKLTPSVQEQGNS